MRKLAAISYNCRNASTQNVAAQAFLMLSHKYIHPHFPLANKEAQFTDLVSAIALHIELININSRRMQENMNETLIRQIAKSIS